jgi:CBS domain-containing protein
LLEAVPHRPRPRARAGRSHGDLVGIVTIGDLVKEIIGQQAQVIDELEHYIRGV